MTRVIPALEDDTRWYATSADESATRLRVDPSTGSCGARGASYPMPREGPRGVVD